MVPAQHASMSACSSLGSTWRSVGATHEEPCTGRKRFYEQLLQTLTFALKIGHSSKDR
jgi:hypothetical protein